ncbi:hypothetical protein F511_29059 [Dorcoceras hygrometricum]|uniref:Uncharacterized protein n=1 Tax=Dorcoceras hygrometricum TaxID=472368 RepID=A0A2Z7A9V1_9LAMI|nr:hypothetical protein F511_29059 [Dorcoceras hygrometricum]
MRITCHWIDNAWNIQKRLLAYRCFNDPHTAQNISHLMFIILEEYGSTSKIFSISFDNESANTCIIDELINCVNHFWKLSQSVRSDRRSELR